MYKALVISVIIGIGTVCSAVGPRIDIYGIKDKVELTPAGGKNTKVVNPSWMKDKKNYFLMAYSPKFSEKWQQYSFSFIPQKNGTIMIEFKGYWEKPKGTDKPVPRWVAYDNIIVDGAEIKNGDFELLNSKQTYTKWACTPVNTVINSESAQSGKNYAIAWHNAPVAQVLNVKKGQKITVSFYAKKATGKESSSK